MVYKKRDINRVLKILDKHSKLECANCDLGMEFIDTWNDDITGHVYIKFKCAECNFLTG